MNNNCNNKANVYDQFNASRKGKTGTGFKFCSLGDWMITITLTRIRNVREKIIGGQIC